MCRNGFEVQHQAINANRATADLPNITDIFDPVIPETSAASLVFLRNAKYSGFIDELHANYNGLYATDQLDLTSRLKVRVGVRQTSLAPQINVPDRSLGNGVAIEPPNVFTRTDTPVSWNVGALDRILRASRHFSGRLIAILRISVRKRRKTVCKRLSPACNTKQDSKLLHSITAIFSPLPHST